MLPLLEVKVIDRNSEHLGVPIATLMENAGEAVADAIKDSYGSKGERVLVLCGKGNNGGDGFVAARHLSKDVEVRVLLVEPEHSIRSKIAANNFEHVREISHVIGSIEDVVRELEPSSIVVDALLGVGVSGAIREPYTSIIRLVNSSGKKIVSIDVPSGLGCDTQIKPDMTVTFHDRKTGMTEANSGRILVSDIGIPPEAELYTGPGDLIFYNRPESSSHKGQNGRLLIVGGGPYTGAPALAAIGAQKAGVDLVHLAIPRPISQVVAGFSPNFIVYPIGTPKEGYFAPGHIDQIATIAESCDAAVIGPGCGSKPETLNAIVELITKLNLPLVIDADALSAVGRDLTRIKGRKTVLTPHMGEFTKVFQKEMSDDLPEQSDVLKKFAASIGCTILLKGSVDVISDGEHVKENHTGNPGMTSGGTGDVLAGVVGALLAKGASPFHAARMASFIVGAAGDQAFQEMSYGFTATDLAEMIPMILKRYLP